MVHLIDLGHSRIAHIAGLFDGRVGAERYAAYRDALQRIGYPVRPEYVRSGDFSAQSGYDGMKQLLALADPPTVVTTACDVQAVGAIRAIEEAGLRCPDDVAVTGFDDAPWAATMSPSLTTVRQPAREVGRTAVDVLVGLIKDPSMQAPKITLPATLVLRESSGRAREREALSA
jgi:LacI family transcriptional regulator